MNDIRALLLKAVHEHSVSSLPQARLMIASCPSRRSTPIRASLPSCKTSDYLLPAKRQSHRPAPGSDRVGSVAKGHTDSVRLVARPVVRNPYKAMRCNRCFAGTSPTRHEQKSSCRNNRCFAQIKMEDDSLYLINLGIYHDAIKEGVCRPVMTFAALSRPW